MSSSARHRLSYIPEVTYGTTPATPAFINFSHISTSLSLTKDATTSKTQRQDRQVHHTRHGLRHVAGDVVGDFAPLTYDDFLAAAFCSTWQGAGPFTLGIGSARTPFSILRTFLDQQSGDKPFYLFKGVEVNTMSLTVDTKDDVSIKFGLIGKTAVDPSTTAPTGATFGAEQTQVPFNGLSGAIQEGGVDIAQITGISLTLENGMEERPVLMTAETRLPKQGRATVSGSVTALFENSSLLEKFITGVSSSLLFSLVMGNYTYEFSIPSVKYNGGQPDTSEQADIVLTLPFVASYDAGITNTIQLTKTIDD